MHREAKGGQQQNHALHVSHTGKIDKIQFRQLLHNLSIENRPEDWERLEAKYDEGGKYRQAYLDSKKADSD